MLKKMQKLETMGGKNLCLNLQGVVVVLDVFFFLSKGSISFSLLHDYSYSSISRHQHCQARGLSLFALFTDLDGNVGVIGKCRAGLLSGRMLQAHNITRNHEIHTSSW